MKTRIWIACLILIGLTTSLWALSPQANTAVQADEPPRATRMGAWLDQVVFTEEPSPDEALSLLQADELDIFIPSYIADRSFYQTVLEATDLEHTVRSGNFAELTFNPHGPEFNDGRLNPFSNTAIRQAMNRLIDRTYITQIILGGLATPRLVPVHTTSSDYARYQTTIDAIDAAYAYDFAAAETEIATQMTAMGAYLDGGTWHYDGEEVILIVLIRTEDERRQVGDYLADQLEAIGFAVERQYKPSSEALQCWILQDPAVGCFHIYTGGWVAEYIDRDEAGNFDYFYTPRGEPGIPLWEAYAPSPTFDDVAARLAVNDFMTMGERNTLFQQALDLAMDDSGVGSVRNWLYDKANFAPRRQGTTVVSDLLVGIYGSEMWPYATRFDGVEGGTMRVGMGAFLDEVLNPVAGSGWVYDGMPVRPTQDYAFIADPNDGLLWPQRAESAEVVVLDGLPVVKTRDWVTLSTAPQINVPPDAWVDWNATTQEFITAADAYPGGLTATVKSTVHYPVDLFSTVRWHDGSPLDVADFVMKMILTLDRGNPDSAIYDDSAAGDLEAFMYNFRGVRIVSEDPLIIETYSDRFELDAELSVVAWWPNYTSGPGAWHNLAAAIRAEAAGQLAFSQEKANNLGVPWADFTYGPSLGILEGWMDTSAAGDYIPYAPTLGDYISPTEADARWANLQAWHAARGHFWLGTGPFSLDSADPDTDTLTLLRNPDFPDEAGRWDAFAAPPAPELAIDYTSGAPGSYFNVTGSGFPPDSTASIVVNDHLLDHVPVNSSGEVAFTLTTDEAGEGTYHLRVTVNPSGGLAFALDEAEPVHPKVGVLPEVEVPAGVTRSGAWLDSVVFTEEGSSSNAVLQLQADELDLYIPSYSADPSLYQEVLEAPELEHTVAYGNYNELTFNPYGPTFNDGRLNPFSNTAIREAMNRLIDRTHVTQVIQGGLARPTWLPVHSTSTDHARYQATIDAIEASYAYDFAAAETEIATQMGLMGASLYHGTWHYGGQEVTLVVLSRTEDERTEIGDYVADQLEAIGFAVERQYMPSSEASECWLWGDPADGCFHIYTGGWLAEKISRDEGGNFELFYTPNGVSTSPLWQAYDPSTTFNDVAGRLATNDFATMGERDSLFQWALDMAMYDSGAGSVRNWLSEKARFAPRRAGTTVVSDLAAGIHLAEMWPYITRFDGVEGGSMRIGMGSFLDQVLNPVAGSGWTYDTMPVRPTQDYAFIADPTDGLLWPQRAESAEVVVLDGLPVVKTRDWVTLSTVPQIDVPPDAWVDWDATAQEFITAADAYPGGLTATVKSTVTYPDDLFSTVSWHDGSPLDVADFVMTMILTFDRGNPDSAIYDDSAAGDLEAFMYNFRGVRIISEDPLVIETYSDRFELDAELSVVAWWPNYASGPGAWHNLAAALRAEEAEELAFSRGKADSLGIPWADFTYGPSLGILEGWMDLSADEDYIPYQATLGDYISPAEAATRWSALQAWHAARGHFWLGTGPFSLESADPDADTLTLLRNPDFPDLAGRWDAFAAPPAPELMIDHTSSAPGSYLNVTGTGFLPDSTASVVANGHLLGQVTADGSGEVAFTLTTDEADEGTYHLRVTVNPSGGLAFELDVAEPVYPKVGELEEVEVPEGLVSYHVYLPVVMRNWP